MDQEKTLDEVTVDLAELLEQQSTLGPEPGANRTGLFSVSGQAKYTKEFCFWFSKVTKGLSIAEACGVLITNPTLVKNVKDCFPNVKIVFNEAGIRDSLNT